MKIRNFTLLIALFVAVGAFAQPTAVIKQASVAPVIDGVIDEVWAEADAEHAIDQPYREEVPTVGASGATYWKALWTGDGGVPKSVYVLLVVDDDDFYPHYIPELDSWEADKPEIYFDVNFILDDGVGPSVGGSGHYQFAPEFVADFLGGELQTGDNGFEYAMLVNDPDYVAEYHIPADVLLTGEGTGADFTETIGFDVTIIDRDEATNTRDRAVWANVGAVDECWSNMDDAGEVTFEGAVSPIWIDEITINETDPVIDENNGKVMLTTSVIPTDATETALAWTVENGTGRATIDGSTGELTAVIDGTVTVTVASAYAEASVEVTISNQIVTMPEINLMRNGYMEDFNEEENLDVWNRPVIDGALYIAAPPMTGNWWENGAMTGQTGFGLNPDDDYTLSFVLWSDAPDTFYVDFEDPANDYNRFGSSTHPSATGLSDASEDGQSQWEFVTTTDPMKYTYDVVFNEWVDNTQETFNIMGGKHEEGDIYLDSIVLYRNDDLSLLTEDYMPVEAITITNESTVAIGGSLVLSADVAPAEATLTDLAWEVMPVTGWAHINEAGELVGDSAGIVMVHAMAKDDSKEMAELEVTVTWPEGIAQQQLSKLEVYPNPALNELNVVTTPNTLISVYNSVGTRMFEAVSAGTVTRLDVSELPGGIYFVKSDNAVARFVK